VLYAAVSTALVYGDVTYWRTVVSDWRQLLAERRAGTAS
jgi:hypothetical protein